MSNRKIKRKKIKFDKDLLHNGNKIDLFSWRVGDFKITLKPTKGYTFYKIKTN
jgi:hypothetical protein